MASKKFVGTSKGTTLTKEDVEKIKNPDTKKIGLVMFLYIWMRSYLLQSSFNYSNYQGNGYAYALFPALKKIYGSNSEGLQNSLRKNSLFYNTNPQTLPLILSIHISMLAAGESEDNAVAVKMALMGPLSGIGDSLSQFCIAPIFSSIAATIALDNNAAGPVIFIVGINVVLIGIKIMTGYIGYRLGTTYISQLSNKLTAVLNVGSMIGITVIVALAVTFVKVNVNVVGIDEDGNEYFNLSTMVENILPYFFSVLTIFAVYQIIVKLRWSIYKLIMAIIVIGLIGGATGILV